MIKLFITLLFSFSSLATAATYQLDPAESVSVESLVASEAETVACNDLPLELEKCTIRRGNSSDRDCLHDQFHCVFIGGHKIEVTNSLDKAIDWLEHLRKKRLCK